MRCHSQVIATLLQFSPDERAEIKAQQNASFLRVQTQAVGDVVGWAGSLVGWGGT